MTVDQAANGMDRFRIERSLDCEMVVLLQFRSVIDTTYRNLKHELPPARYQPHHPRTRSHAVIAYKRACTLSLTRQALPYAHGNRSRGAGARFNCMYWYWLGISACVMSCNCMYWLGMLSVAWPSHPHDAMPSSSHLSSAPCSHFVLLRSSV